MALLMASNLLANDTAPRMNPGRFERFAIQKINDGPVFFIIGVEKGSLAWLQANADFF